MGKSETRLNMLTIISVAITVLLLVLIFKFKGGMLGIALGAIAVAVLVYWLKEMNRIFREESRITQREWFYDLIDEGEYVIFTARVPGPAGEVKAQLYEGGLKIRGGGGFEKTVKVPSEVKIKEMSYINGVLHVKLQRMEKPRRLGNAVKRSG